MTVEELIQKLSLINPKAKVLLAVRPECPTFHDPWDVTYFEGLDKWSVDFDPDAISGNEIVFISSHPDNL